MSLKIEMVESTKELNRSNTTIALPRHVRPLHDPKRMPKRHGGNPYRRRRPSDDEDIYRPSQTLLDSEQLNITQRERHGNKRTVHVAGAVHKVIMPGTVM